MKKQVILSICGRQNYVDQEPDTIELVTEGTLEYRDGGWDVCYQESELTGLKGVNTTFRIEGDTITLTRDGGLASQMVFQEGKFHESLYQTEFGFAMMITVCASKVKWDLTENGGLVDLTYAIEIENSAAGVIDYHLDMKAV